MLRTAEDWNTKQWCCFIQKSSWVKKNWIFIQTRWPSVTTWL